MKNKSLIVFVFSLFALSIQAQNFQYDPAQHIDEEIQEENYSYHEIRAITHDLSGVHFRWILIENTFPEDWSYSLCDLGGCYVGIPGSGTMTEITNADALNGVQGFLKLNITASTFYGEGDVVFYVYEIGDTANGDTVSMHISWPDPASSLNDVSLNKIQMYPNPVTDEVHFTNLIGVEQIDIIGINGQQLYALKPKGAEFTLSCTELPEGIYFAKLRATSGESVTKRLVKK